VLLFSAWSWENEASSSTRGASACAARAAGYQTGIAPKPTRLRPTGLRRGSPRHLCRAKALATADHPCSRLQGILAKANK